MTREPEWDTPEREERFDFVAHEAEIHAGCGQHDSVAGTRDLRIEPLECPDCADIEKMMRIQRARDEADDRTAAVEYGGEFPPSAKRAGDGRRWSIRVLTPEEKAAEANASATSGSGSSAGRRRPRRGSRPPQSRSTSPGSTSQAG